MEIGIHPFCTYFSMVTEPHKGPGAEDVLLNALYSSKGAEPPLQTSIGENSSRLIDFYMKAGFREIRRTYLAVLETEYIATDMLLPGGKAGTYILLT
jgi:hypothetical protein